MRQGRIEKITEKELVFKNSHIIPAATPDTLFIDCSATATGFSHPKVIFSGDTINLQMVIIPQPCYSSSIIAALELKYPEDEAIKNQVILDSIAVSVFDDIFIELTNTVSDGKIQITILILRRGALSRLPSFIICISYNLFQNTLKDEDSNAFWNRSSFKETNIYQERTHSRNLSYKERNKSIITTSPSNQTPVLSPQPPSPPCTKPPEDENNCPTLDINDTKTFTDYYSFPPITLIDDLEVWDEEDEEET